MKFVSAFLACMLWGTAAVSKGMPPKCDDGSTTCDGDSEDFALLALRSFKRKDDQPVVTHSGAVHVHSGHGSHSSSTITHNAPISSHTAISVGGSAQAGPAHPAPHYPRRRYGGGYSPGAPRRRYSPGPRPAYSPPHHYDYAPSGHHGEMHCETFFGENTDGHNLPNMPWHAQDSAQCCNFCSRRGDCAHWTYVHGNGECWMKSGRPHWRYDSAVTSGTRAPSGHHGGYLLQQSNSSANSSATSAANSSSQSVLAGNEFSDSADVRICGVMRFQFASVGHPFNDKFAIDAVECCHFCTVNSRCSHWTWWRDSNECVLMDGHEPTYVENENAISADMLLVTLAADTV